MMIKIYVTMYLEIEKIKIIALVSPMGKRGFLSAFMVHLGLMGMRVSLSSYCEPL